MSASLFGMPVTVEQLTPRYVLPNDVPPPPDMTREQFDAWSRLVCGYHPPLLPDGQVFKTPYSLHMNATTWAMVRQQLQKQGGAA